MIKAIFFDVDGTLLTFSKPKCVPESTREALEALRAQGIKLFVATGRAPLLIENLKEYLDFDFDGYITMNGQYCFDQEHVIHQEMLSKEDLIRVLPYLEKENIGCNFVELDYIYLNCLNDRVKEAWRHFGIPINDDMMDSVERVKSKDTYQLTAYIPEEEEEALMAYLPSCKSARWHPGFTDIISKSGGKNKGIEKVLAHYGIDKSETMAFGDGGNDIEMLEFVQIGVAMGNAKDDVKAAADYVTAAVDDDGVIKAVKHFKLI